MSNNEKYAIREGVVSVVVNIFLFAIKFWAGTVSMSAALIADAWHTLSDSLSSLVVIWGSWLSSKPADERHPFGHGRAELIATLLVGAFLGFIGYEFLNKGLLRIVNQEEAVFGTIAIVVTVASIVFKELLAQYAFWGFRKSGLPSIKADAWHHRSDALSSLVVLVGIFIAKYYWWIDGALSIIIGFMLFYTAYQVISDGSDRLLGIEPSKQLVEKLMQICQDVLGDDQTLHHIHQHIYGTHKEITFHIKMEGSLTLDECQFASSKIEARVKSDLGMEATIHIDPIVIKGKFSTRY